MNNRKQLTGPLLELCSARTRHAHRAPKNSAREETSPTNRLSATWPYLHLAAAKKIRIRGSYCDGAAYICFMSVVRSGKCWIVLTHHWNCCCCLCSRVSRVCACRTQQATWIITNRHAALLQHQRTAVNNRLFEKINNTSVIVAPNTDNTWCGIFPPSIQEHSTKEETIDTSKQFLFFLFLFFVLLWGQHTPFSAAATLVLLMN